MQRLSGLLLVLAGTALASYAYLPPAADAEQKPAEVTEASVAPDRSNQDHSTQAPGRSFSPAAPLTGSAQSAKNEAAKNAPAPVVTASIATKPAVASATAPIKPWTAVVTTETQTERRLTSSKPGDDATRLQLTRDLQRELQRVGCYGGEVTGNWTPSTKRAMSAFMDRVNATLPIEEPDYILLTLVQGHTAAACGATCPSGQGMSNDGRCVPQAVIAQATRKSQREEQRRIAAIEDQRKSDERKAAEEQRVAEEYRAVEERKVAEERRASEERKVADARARADADRIAMARATSERLAQERFVQERVAQERLTQERVAQERVAQERLAQERLTHERLAQESKRQTLAAAQPVEELPWAKQNTAPATASAERSAPPPGMMAIGGPKAEAAAVAPKSVLALNADALEQPDDSAKEPSAAPVLNNTPPKPVPAARPQTNLPEQGLPGTKAGPSAHRHFAPEPRYAEPPLRIYKPQQRPQHVQRPQAQPQYVRRPPPPVFVFKAPKPKTYYYASNTSVRSHHRDSSRLAPSHYNMMQSLGGFY